MKLGMTYKDIIKHSPNGSEAMMWDAVERVDKLVAKLRKENPEMARDFMRDSYEAMNGKHINEWLAGEMVDKMWHKDSRGNIVRGAIVSANEAERMLLDGMDTEKKEMCKWDAYVAANAFAHDLANTGRTNADIMVMAKHFWFHDDDMDEGCHKVYWYFKDWIFD